MSRDNVGHRLMGLTQIKAFMELFLGTFKDLIPGIVDSWIWGNAGNQNYHQKLLARIINLGPDVLVGILKDVLGSPRQVQLCKMAMLNLGDFKKMIPPLPPRWTGDTLAFPSRGHSSLSNVYRGEWLESQIKILWSLGVNIEIQVDLPEGEKGWLGYTRYLAATSYGSLADLLNPEGPNLKKIPLPSGVRSYRELEGFLHTYLEEHECSLISVEEFLDRLIDEAIILRVFNSFDNDYESKVNQELFLKLKGYMGEGRKYTCLYFSNLFYRPIEGSAAGQSYKEGSVTICIDQIENQIIIGYCNARPACPVHFITVEKVEKI